MILLATLTTIVLLAIAARRLYVWAFVETYAVPAPLGERLACGHTIKPRTRRVTRTSLGAIATGVCPVGHGVQRVEGVFLETRDRKRSVSEAITFVGHEVRRARRKR